MEHLEKLEAAREAQAKTNQGLLPPEILAFARQIRETFGSGVKLHKGLPWPGGASTKGSR